MLLAIQLSCRVSGSEVSCHILTYLANPIEFAIANNGDERGENDDRDGVGYLDTRPRPDDLLLGSAPSDQFSALIAHFNRVLNSC